MDGRRILPVSDRDSAHYWSALAKGALELQQCRDCGHWTWPPRPICSSCHGESLEWQAVKGTGDVHSWVVSHRAYTPDFVALVPYTIALVRIDEQDDILIPGRLLSDVAVYQGLRVRAAPEQLSDKVGLLNWKVDAKP